MPLLPNLAVIGALLLFVSSAQANNDALREKALNSDLAYQLVESLTVDVGPRIAGSDGDKRAVAWAEEKFHALGFDKVYKQPVRVRNWSRGRAQATIISPQKQSLAVTALGGSVATPAGGITLPVVTFDSLEQLVEATVEQVQGKIVFINKKMQRDRAGRGYGPVVVGRSRGAIEASKLGAAAVVIRSVSTANSRFAHTGAMQYSDEVKKIPAAAISNVDADLLAKTLNEHPELTLFLDMDNQEHGWQTSYNVIGEITGSENPDEFVLLAAHLDSWDEGTGALDDGAGVGIVMAAAALVKEVGAQPKRSIRVVLYANEEFGLIGAKEYVRANKTTLDRIIVAAESDFGAGAIYELATRFSDSTLHYREDLHAALAPLGIELAANDATGGPDISLLPNYGVPVISLKQDGTFYFDYHHTADDTLDKIKPKDLQQNLAAYAVFADLVANSTMQFRPIDNN